jgi:putative oxidoreductase
MDLALLVLRLVVGAFFVGHGAQKLFGAFGGHGPGGTAQFMQSLGLHPARLQAYAAGTAEFVGGLLLLLGLLTPVGAAAIIGTMTVAIVAVHAKNGPWVTNSGWEYNAVLIAVAVALAGAGPGDWSVDAAAGLDLAGTEWALAALGAGLLGGIAAIVIGRSVLDRPSRTPATATARSGRFDRTEVGGAPVGADPELDVATAGRERDGTLER